MKTFAITLATALALPACDHTFSTYSFTEYEWPPARFRTWPEGADCSSPDCVLVPRFPSRPLFLESRITEGAEPEVSLLADDVCGTSAEYRVKLGQTFAAHGHRLELVIARVPIEDEPRRRWRWRFWEPRRVGGERSTAFWGPQTVVRDLGPLEGAPATCELPLEGRIGGVGVVATVSTGPEPRVRFEAPETTPWLARGDRLTFSGEPMRIVDIVAPDAKTPGFVRTERLRSPSP